MNNYMELYPGLTIENVSKQEVEFDTSFTYYSVWCKDIDYVGIGRRGSTDYL